MSRVDISSAGFSKVLLPNGMLQTDSALNTTLQIVKDNVGNSSTLLLSSIDAQFNSTLRIHTDSSELLDIEDTGANNRFNINRVVQKINLDFSSKPTDTTTVVGAIRTATNGSNLADVFTFLENGTVGLNNPAPSSTYKLDIIGNVNASSYIVSGGTSSQFLKANGSLDSTAYTPQTRTLTINGTAQDLSADRSWTIPTYSPPNGLLRTANAISSTLQTVTDYLNNTTSLQLNNGRVGILSDSSVATQTSAVIQATTTNANLVLNPNGTGAIVASIPDGTATGGNARGQYAVDLQLGRGFNYEVASGNYSVAIGYGNSSSGLNSIAMGNRNNASGQGSTAIGGGLGGGQGVNATANFATAIGGVTNTASSNYSIVSGGQNNTASTNTHATVVGGYINTASGQYSVAGGTSSNASGGSAIAIGNQATASGANSIALGGQTGGGGGVTASGQGSVVIGLVSSSTQPYSVALGYYSRSFDYGKYTYANGASGQFSRRIAKKSAALLNAAGTVALTLNDSSQTIVFQTGAYDSAMSVTVDWVATCKIVGSGTLTRYDTIAGKDFFKISVNNQTTSLGTITRIATSSDASMATSNMTYSLSYSGTTGYLYLTYTAPTTANGSTFHIVATVDMTEITNN